MGQQEVYRQWRAVPYFDEVTRAELAAAEDRFCRELESHL